MKRTILKRGALLAFVSAGAFGAPLYTSGSQGNFSFSALFESVGSGDLKITLTNTSATAATSGGDVLGALFFSVAGNPILTPESLLLGVGSSVVNGSGDPSANWEYKGGLSGPGGATQGVSATGYGVFGPDGNFCSGAGCGDLLDGIDWGVVGSSYAAGSGNASISGRPLVRDSLVFHFSGVPAGFDPSTGITRISAQYSSGLDGTNVPGSPRVPEPTSYLLIAGGLIGLGIAGRVRRRGTEPRQ